MATITGTHGDTGQGGTFLGGWGGVVSVLLGIAAGYALWPVLDELVLLLHTAIIDAGLTSEAATMTLYWFGIVAIGAGFVIAFNGPDVRMERLRAGLGDWPALVPEVLTAACVVVLWFTAAVTWANFEDEFTTYGAGIELPAFGLVVLMVVGALLLRWTRRRRASESGRHV